MSLLNLFRRARKPDLDDSVLVRLRRAGSNLSLPHAIEFFLYFPTQAIAEQAATQVRDAGFEAEVGSSAKGNDWLCLATRKMVPELAAMQRIRQNFNSLASSMGGEYDGWGTEVEK
jgi:hypothetical protein